MFVKINKEIQIELLKNAIKKAGSERKLEKLIIIPNSSIHDYSTGKHKLTLERFRKLIGFLDIKETILKFELIDPKIYRVKGGKSTYKKYLTENRFEEVHKKMRNASSRKMKDWHREMKKQDPEKYYKLQYNRFKKIADYSFKTNRGEKVRNELELQVANKLFGLKIDYLYEPYLKTREAVFFPDFQINKLIIECTMWKGIQKAYSLAEKITKLEEEGYTVKVVIPDNLRQYYKPIERHIVNIFQLDEFLPE